MFSHVTLGVSDLDAAGRFYDAVLGPLGLAQRAVTPDGGPAQLCWWVPGVDVPRIYVGRPFDGHAASAGNGAMLCLIAPSRPAVDAAHAGGLEAGGSCAGAPGPRPHYEPDYYGAYLRDPDGNKLGMVHRAALVPMRAWAE